MDVKELRDRLYNALNSVHDLYNYHEKTANSGHPDSIGAVNEQRRLAGKEEGIKLAISYLEEMSR